MPDSSHTSVRKLYAPINVNPVGGGECGQGVGDLTNFKIF